MWVDVEHWWSRLLLLMHSELLDLICIVNCCDVCIHILLKLRILTQFLWLSEIWEARIHLEVKLNLISTSELLLDEVA